jgi:ribose-phosphate pyrophosphokinase
MARNKLVVIGFKDEAALVRSAARKLRARSVFAVESKFRAGEISVSESAGRARRVIVVSNVTEAPSSLFRILLLASAARTAGAQRVELLAPWIAYGRQDRPTATGEAPAGIILAKLLSHSFDRIVTLDAHSDAFMRAFRGRLVDVLQPMPSKRSFDLVVAPDRGAKTRAAHMAKLLRVPCIVIDKRRDGEKITSRLAVRERLIKDVRVLLVDDIADSGGTLEAAACVLKTAGARSVSALLTHTVDLRALNKRLRPNVSDVSSFFDHATNKLQTSALEGLIDAMRN